MEQNQQPNDTANGKSVLKRIVRIIFWFVLVVILFFASLVALLFVYEDEVKAAIIGELNKSLRAEVKVDPRNIDLTIIKTFPDCSIEFKNLLMLEALKIKRRDTLLFAGQLNLHFNIENLWNKKYEIEKITLSDAVIKLQMLKNGQNNYTFWKQASDKAPQNKTNFKLQLISLYNVRLSYKNKQALFKTELDVESVLLKGNFSASDFELESEGKVLIKTIVQNKISYLNYKTCAFDLSMNVKGDEYQFKKADINLNQLALKLSGQFNYKDSLQNLIVNYDAPELDIASALSLLPETYKHKINDYESAGNFYAHGSFKYSGQKSFLVQSSFGVKNGKVKYKRGSTEVEGLNLEGRLSYSKQGSLLELKNISLNLEDDKLRGSCMIQNFADPFVQFSAEASFNLENIQRFWPIDTLTQLKGAVTLTTHVSGLLDDLKRKTFSKNVELTLNTSLTALEVQFKNDDKIYSVESCSLNAVDRNIEVHDLKLKRGESDLKVNGKIPGLFNYLVDKNESLIIEGNLFSNNFRMEDFIVVAGPSQANNKPLIPANVEFKLNAAILKFGFAKFSAQSITGEIEIKNQKAIISDMKLQVMDGEAQINAFADNSNNRLDVVLQSELNGINVNQLFMQFNNFGQSTLEDKHIKGYATATIDFSGSWNNNLESDYKSVKVNSKLKIKQGELIEFKPLLSLSKYVDVKELQRIKFSDLEANVDIKDQLITIAKTSVKNSVLDIDFFGTHSFSNNIDYHFQLLISNYLAKKRKNNPDDFGPLENDPENRRSAYILMTGNIDDPVIKYDRLGLKEKIKSDIKQERQNIKQVLKEEFGIFKKDTVRKRTEASQQSFEFEKPAKHPEKNTSKPPQKQEDDEDF